MISLLIFSLFADFDLTGEIWKFEKGKADFGLDISATGGYGIPLNLNGKPDNRDIAKKYDPIAPAIFGHASLGMFSNFDKIDVNYSIGLEFSMQAFKSNSAGSDLDFYKIGFKNRLYVHPTKRTSVISGTISGLFVLDAKPNLHKTNTFMDYTSDVDARTNSAHIFQGRELGFGFNVGKKPRFEICATARLDTYYPRYIFWKELARGITTSTIDGVARAIAKKTGVWSMIHIGNALNSAIEIFNLNFYPDAVGESHQHIITPALTLTYHF